EDITQHSENYTVDRRVEFVWHLPHHNVDIICYSNCRSYVDVISKFDCNLNQFFLPSTIPDFDNGIPYNPSLQESPVYLGSDSPETLVFLKWLPQARI